jgi:hydrogenase nickel incorporation protein HypA/HybF
LHEVSVALSLLENIESEAREQAIERVAAVRVRLGTLSGIARDALLFSWDVVTADTICQGSRLEIEEVPLAIFCRHCAAEREPHPGYGVLCPACGSVSSQIVRGREMELVAMEVPA